MAERGILFSAPMVRALLSGTKTQTRRIMKPRPGSVPDAGSLAAAANPFGAPGDRLWVRETFFAYGRWETRFDEKTGREGWRFVDMTIACGHAHRYAADAPDLSRASGRGLAPGWHVRSALFMPRAVSRIVLEIGEVRAERLHALTVDDALAEGVERRAADSGNDQVYRDYAAADAEGEDRWFASPVDSYRTLWERINGAGGWDANPWVWCVSFRRIA